MEVSDYEQFSVGDRTTGDLIFNRDGDEPDREALGEYFEQNHKKVLYILEALPDFPLPHGHVDGVAIAAFNTTSGPTCLINEVMIVPDLDAPESIYELLEDARILQNRGMYDGALKRCFAALEIWKDPGLWQYCESGKDATQLRQDKAARAQARQQAISKQERNEDRAYRREAKRVAIVEAQLASEEAAIQARKEKHARSMYGAMFADTDDIEGADQKSGSEEPEDLLDPILEAEISDDEPFDHELLEEDLPPAVPTAEDEMEFRIFLWNTVGSIYMSKGDSDELALLHFWRAKVVHDDYLANKLGAKNIQNELARKAEGKQEEAEHIDALREFLRDGNADVKQAQDSSEDTAFITLYGADGVKRVKRSALFPSYDLKAVQPLRGASPVTAVTWSNLGAAAYHLKKPYVGLCCYFAAQQIRFQCLNEQTDEYVDIASTLNNIGVCLHGLKRYKESCDYFSSAHEIFCDRLNLVHPRINVVKNNLAKVAPKRQQVNVDSLQSLVTMSKAGPKLQLRSWNVAMSAEDKLITEYGPPKKKKGAKKKKKGNRR